MFIRDTYACVYIHAYDIYSLICIYFATYMHAFRCRWIFTSIHAYAQHIHIDACNNSVCNCICTYIDSCICSLRCIIFVTYVRMYIYAWTYLSIHIICTAYFRYACVHIYVSFRSRVHYVGQKLIANLLLIGNSSLSYSPLLWLALMWRYHQVYFVHGWNSLIALSCSMHLKVCLASLLCTALSSTLVGSKNHISLWYSQFRQ